MRQYKKVLIRASELLQQYPNSYSVYNVIGLALHGAKKFERAIKAFNKAIALNPGYVLAQSNLGNVFKEQGKLKDAEYYYNAAISLDPQFHIAYNNLGLVLKDQNRLDEALAAFETALRTRPDYADAHNNLGVTFYEQGNFQKAKTYYKQALSANPRHVSSYNNLGNLFYEEGNLSEAVNSYRSALNLNPNYANAHNNLGNALRDLDDLDAALKAYKTAISKNPNLHDAFNNLGIVLKNQGKLEEGMAAYTSAHSLKADNLAYNLNIIKLLKYFTPVHHYSNRLVSADKEIKKLNSDLLNAKSYHNISSLVSLGLSHIGDLKVDHLTPSTQIYSGIGIDLNCSRHKHVFKERKIIPEFCFGCFKLQIDVNNFDELIRLTAVLYKFNFETNLNKKTMIELRKNVPGFYKGFVYCDSLVQAENIKSLMDPVLHKEISPEVSAKIKRGCSEYALDFPEYAKLSHASNEMMFFPKEWKLVESEFDLPKKSDTGKIFKKLKGFCLSDFLIIEKWIDYAKAIGDQTVEHFSERPIKFEDIYKAARERVRS